MEIENSLNNLIKIHEELDKIYSNNNKEEEIFV